jgi:hypothetical protein
MTDCVRARLWFTAVERRAMKVLVNAYSGYKANERPASFMLAGNSYHVETVLDQWYGPDSVYFKVVANDRNQYILKYSLTSDEWTLESFRQSPAGG